MSRSVFSTDAQAVRTSIADDVKAGSEALVRFVSTYARAAKDRNEALAIRASLAEVEDPIALEDLRNRMTNILDRILQESVSDDTPAESSPARRTLFSRNSSGLCTS